MLVMSTHKYKNTLVRFGVRHGYRLCRQIKLALTKKNQKRRRDETVIKLLKTATITYNI